MLWICHIRDSDTDGVDLMTEHIITEERLHEIIENAYKNGFNDGQAEGLMDKRVPYVECNHSYASCPINWDAHNRAIRNATINEFYKRIKAERDPSLEYVDWDSIEAVFIRLRGGGE